MDRPVGKLVRVVKAGEQISEKGQGICPLSQANEEIQAAWDQEDDVDEQEELQDVPGVHLGPGVVGNVQEDERHLPASPSPPPPPPVEPLHAMDPPEDHKTPDE